MRRVIPFAALLMLTTAWPAAAQAPAAQSPAAQSPAGPPHAWLFGAWIGGIFPPPVTLSPQECFAQPTVIFTRDVVMRAVLTDPAYVQRLIETGRATGNGFEFRFAPASPATAEPGGMLLRQPTSPGLGFGCRDPDSLTVQRRGESEISFPNCADFPYPLIRCVPR